MRETRCMKVKLKLGSAARAGKGRRDHAAPRREAASGLMYLERFTSRQVDGLPAAGVDGVPDSLAVRVGRHHARAVRGIRP